MKERYKKSPSKELATTLADWHLENGYDLEGERYLIYLEDYYRLSFRYLKNGESERFEETVKHLSEEKVKRCRDSHYSSCSAGLSVECCEACLASRWEVCQKSLSPSLT